MRRSIDLNADVGEERGDDRALLALVSSANVATGAHAGGGSVLVDTVAAAVAAGCAVGAHPSYPDREGFGRRRPPQVQSDEVLTDELARQITVVAAACLPWGASLAHVKPHGALYNDAADDPAVARCVLDAIVEASRALGVEVIPVVGLAGSTMEEVASARSHPFIGEAFADRGYDDHGRLIPRSMPGAMLTNVEAVRERVLDIVSQGRVRAVGGSYVDVRADTICLHGDTAGAVEFARAAREVITESGIDISTPWRAR